VLPERIALAQILDAEQGNPADQVFRQWLVIPHLQEVLSRLVRSEFVTKCLERRRGRREVEMCFVSGKRINESRLNEEWRAPLNRLVGVGIYTLEDFVNAAQMLSALGGSRFDVFGDCRGTPGCHDPLLLTATLDPRIRTDAQ
jgi:hypothetical protein